MAKNQPKVVIDTNVIISSLLFGGKPQEIIKLIIEREIIPITSKILIAELTDVLVKKFNFIPNKTALTEEFIKENFQIVYPSIMLDIISDKDDNRVLEAAVVGKCQYIITGDKDLLDLKSYNKIIILTAGDFLDLIGTK